MEADDIKYMEMALREAEKAAEDGEVPTGCVIVDTEGRILGRAHNQTEGLADATAHAEMLALSAAFNAKGNWRLTGTTASCGESQTRNAAARLSSTSCAIQG